MPKKVITGKTKLSNRKHIDEEKLRIVSPGKEKVFPKSYRLKQSDLQSLRSIVDNVNKISRTRVISETDVVRALINIGTKLKPDKILSAYRDIIF